MADETSFGGEDTPWVRHEKWKVLGFCYVHSTFSCSWQTAASHSRYWSLPRPDHGVTFALLKFAPARPRRHIRVTEVCPGQTTASHSRYLSLPRPDQGVTFALLKFASPCTARPRSLEVKFRWTRISGTALTKDAPILSVLSVFLSSLTKMKFPNGFYL